MSLTWILFLADFLWGVGRRQFEELFSGLGLELALPPALHS